MPMPPNSTGENSLWWNNWHLAHGEGTTLEVAFQGYLTQQGLQSFALTKVQLDSAYSAFVAWWSPNPLPNV